MNGIHVVRWIGAAAFTAAACACGGPGAKPEAGPLASTTDTAVVPDPAILRPADVASVVEELGFQANGPGEAAADRRTAAMFFVDMGVPAGGLADFILLVERSLDDVRVYQDRPRPPFAQSLPPTAGWFFVRNVVVIDSRRDPEASARLRAALETR